MASTKATFLIIYFFCLLFLAHGTHPFGIEAIYQFGDSLSDTGNLIRDNPIRVHSSCARLPYGIFFFHHPTGRCSDGLLMIDYFVPFLWWVAGIAAKFFNLPLLDPYLKKDGNFIYGVNFAVAGATALDSSILASKNISSPHTNSSLSVQLSWFDSHLHSICTSSADCKNMLKKALFFMGEIGGNDVNYAIKQGKPVEFLQEMVPEIVQSIRSAVDRVIKLGAIQVVIPGNFPIGCIPAFAATFATEDPTMYDELGCLQGLNDFSDFYNDHLQQAIRELQKVHPQTVIIYGDYFHALREVLRHASILGFDKYATLTACCGAGDNKYNYNSSRTCGDKGTQVCPNPYVRVNWDGPHLTSHAYEHVAKFLLKDIVRGISQIA